MKKIIIVVIINLLTLFDGFADSDSGQKHREINTGFIKNQPDIRLDCWRAEDLINKKSPINLPTTLQLTISGIKNNNGTIRVIVWDNKKTFIREDLVPTKFLVLPAKHPETVVLIEGLDPGKSYSIFVHHDQDTKGYLKQGIFGPHDPYGFSNNVRGKFSAPKYEDTLITINGAPTKHTIIIK